MSGAAHSDDVRLAKVRLLDIRSDEMRNHTHRVVEAQANTRPFLPQQQNPPSGAQTAANGVPQAHGAARGRHHPLPQARDQDAGRGHLPGCRSQQVVVGKQAQARMCERLVMICTYKASVRGPLA